MITYSVEHLYHFNCGECKKWWTIGDWKETATQTKLLTCPHCGAEQPVVADPVWGKQ